MKRISRDKCAVLLLINYSEKKNSSISHTQKSRSDNAKLPSIYLKKDRNEAKHERMNDNNLHSEIISVKECHSIHKSHISWGLKK